MSFFRSRSDIIQTVAGILILATAGVGLHYAIRHYQRVEAENRRIAAAVATEQEKEDATAEQARQQRTAKPVRARPAASTPSNVQRYEHKIHVDLEITDEISGVIAYSDGELLFDERLRPGAVRKVDADRELRLIVDKPRAVQIKLNGELVQRADRGRGLILEARYKDGHVSVNTMH